KTFPLPPVLRSAPTTTCFFRDHQKPHLLCGYAWSSSLVVSSFSCSEVASVAACGGVLVLPCVSRHF
ncbi:unnamed protein product, partial [Brassica oleracea]